MTPINAIDFYKADHRSQYPEDTEIVFSNWTPRSSRIPGIDKVVFAGLQGFVKKVLIEDWDRNFFGQPKELVVGQYARRMKNAGLPIDVKHIESLWELGYLPIEIYALPEGSKVPIGVPMFVIWNTLPEYFWLTNYLESCMSCEIWGPCTSATLAAEYRRILEDWTIYTGGDLSFVDWQGHDFSFRGMYGIEAAQLSGFGHLLSFTGTDTVPAIDYVEKYYCANSDKEIVGGSVVATEHSVMCMGSKESELDTFRRLLNLYPTGILSIVSDTWDYWKVLTEILPALKDEILARDGKLVIRPDSGDPIKIICGDPEAPVGSPAHKGTYKLLWELFGGTTNEAGYKVLNPKIGAIYGDSITLERCNTICNRLAGARFVPNMVFGIGSYTYQYQTRDTFGFAMKATYGEVNGEPREIFKDPITDSGTKKSARGLLAVYDDPEYGYVLKQQATWEDVKNCAFVSVFKNGMITKEYTLGQIRQRLRNEVL